MRARKHLHKERGAALILALMLMAALGLFGTAYWSHLHSTLASVREQAKRQAAHALAESGIEVALAEFRAGNPAYVGAPPRALGDGFFKVAVNKEADGALLVESTAALGVPAEPHHPQTVKACIRLGAGGAPVAIQYLPEVH